MPKSSTDHVSGHRLINSPDLRSIIYHIIRGTNETFLTPTIRTKYNNGGSFYFQNS